MNKESPRKSLVKGERFVRHDDSSEGRQVPRLRTGTLSHGVKSRFSGQNGQKVLEVKLWSQCRVSALCKADDSVLNY